MQSTQFPHFDESDPGGDRLRRFINGFRASTPKSRARASGDRRLKLPAIRRFSGYGTHRHAGRQDRQIEFFDEACDLLRRTGPDGWRGSDADVPNLPDRSGREVDFLVTLDRKPWFAVEAKVRETEIDPALVYFRTRLKIPWSYQVVLESNRDYLQEGVRCLPARLFLAVLA